MALDRFPGQAKAARPAGAAVVLALLGVACGGSASSPAAPITTTETFGGRLAAHAVAVYPFTVAQDGTAALTLTSLAPQATITMGMGIGYPAGAGCSLVTVYEASSVGYTLSGPINAGSYCVALYDVGNIQGSDDYVLTLSHT